MLFLQGQFSFLTVSVFLPGVRDQAAVVWSGGPAVRDAVVVVVLVALVPDPVLVRVQLGAVGHRGAVVPGVLVAVPISVVQRERKGRIASLGCGN